MELIVVKCSKPKNFITTNLHFDSLESANKYVGDLKNLFLLKKAKLMEYDLSKRKRKIINHSKPKKYLLTKVGSKYLLWEKY